MTVLQRRVLLLSRLHVATTYATSEEVDTANVERDTTVTLWLNFVA